MCSRYGMDEAVHGWLNNHCIRELASREWATDVRPNNEAPVLIVGADAPTIVPMTWGMKTSSGQIVINARKETLWEKPMFRASIKHRRCLLPASQFYEWDANKHKVTFRAKESSMIYLAGIYREDGGGCRFVVITTAANDVMRPVHDRMPKLVPGHLITQWLYDENSAKVILDSANVNLRRDEPILQMSLWE